MFRKTITKMAPYVPGEQPPPGQQLIKLNTNENPYPPSPRIKRAVIAAAGEALRLYPPPRADAFVDSAAHLYGIPREMIIAGNGSDELLSMVFRAALDPGDRVAYPLPTYSLYDTLASIQAARVAAKPLGPGFTIPLGALAKERATVTIVCNPNAPCGTYVPADDLAKLARQLERRLLVIDEAYVDFAEGNSLHLVREHANIIVLRSLSKSYSLAGLRLGLGFAQPPIIDELLKVKDSYNLNRIALAAGAHALEDSAWMRRNVERVKRTRAMTEERLRAMGFEVPPSSANFVLARIEGHDMAPVQAALRRRGILVRQFPASVFRDALRISIGTPEEMAALFKALEPLARRIVKARQAARMAS
ncbi:MAG: histidinol-phosphate transaminase [Candidatus Binataceae bacterium]